MLNEKINIIAVVGPTAVGKTKLAIELAKKFNGEVISADSMQIYEQMNIATAKPTKEEMCGIVHYMIGFLPFNKNFSVAEYVNLAKKIILKINSKNKIPIVCGGTGLYVSSLLENIEFTKNNVNFKLRDSLYKEAEVYGKYLLWEKLKKIDPKLAKKTHPNNLKKVIRAIEIYEDTGITMTQQIKNSKNKINPYRTTYIGLDYKDRQTLYNKINKRVNEMMQKGLLEEAKIILSANCSKTAREAIGYKEFIPYLNGECTLETAVEKIKSDTRKYAKRQLTWFKRNKDINWIYLDEFKNFDNILKTAIDIINKKL